MNGAGAQFKAEREAFIDKMGCEVVINAAVRLERRAGEGYQRKDRETYGPLWCYVYWSGGSNADRGNQGGELVRQDRDPTWGASLKYDDGALIWPSGAVDAMSTYEMQHPVYGRLRIDRVQQMSMQGINIGWQVGLTRVS